MAAIVLRCSAAIAFVSARSALHSAFDKLAFSPLPKTVSRYTGIITPL
jgi:hypothetical protein